MPGAYAPRPSRSRASPSTRISVASTSPLIQSPWRSTSSASAAGTVRTIRSVSSRPSLLAHRVHLADQVVDAALELELGVERRVERDRDAVRRRDRPALAAAALDEHLVRLELVAGGAEAAAAELLELARLQRLLHGAQLLAEPRPEHRQVRLHAQLGVDAVERDVLHAHLVARSRPRAPRAPVAPSTTSCRSGWRSFSPDVARAWCASVTTRRTSAISSSSAAIRLGDLRPAGEVHRLAARRARGCARDGR